MTRPNDGNRPESLEPLPGRPDQSIATELVTLFLGELERRMPAIQRAWDDQDLDELARFANEMRGTGTTFGYPAITDSAGALEQCLSREADASQVQEQVEELLLLCRRACESTTGDA